MQCFLVPNPRHIGCGRESQIRPQGGGQGRRLWSDQKAARPWGGYNALRITQDGICYSQGMIQNFKDEDTAELFQTRKNRRWQNIKAVALRKLDMVNAASILNDLRVPPGNHLEAL